MNRTSIFAGLTALVMGACSANLPNTHGSLNTKSVSKPILEIAVIPVRKTSETLVVTYEALALTPWDVSVTIDVYDQSKAAQKPFATYHCRAQPSRYTYGQDFKGDINFSGSRSLENLQCTPDLPLKYVVPFYKHRVRLE